MSHIASGVIAGLIFGVITVGMMMPMSFPNKKAAQVGAFFNRFSIGFVIGCVQIPGWPGPAIGALFGLLLSLPSAIITKTYVPILVIGILGGTIIGGIIHGWTFH